MEDLSPLTDERRAEIIEENKQFFKRELELIDSLTDFIPVDPIDQDIRSKNRFREHTGEGHGLSTEGKTSQHQPNHLLFFCECRWIGWLIPPPAKEN